MKTKITLFGLALLTLSACAPKKSQPEPVQPATPPVESAPGDANGNGVWDDGERKPPRS